MELTFIVAAISFTVAFAGVSLLKPIAHNLKLVDEPGGRKVHSGSIPLIGGVAIYLSVSITTFLFLEQILFIRFFLLAGGLIVLIGILDDRYDLSARARLAAQILIASIFVYGLGVNISSFGNLIGVGEFSTHWLGYPLTLLSIIGMMNATNMLDGIDGLVGSLSTVSFIGLMGVFGIAGLANYQLLCLIFVGATCAFLLFNIWGSPTKRQFKKVFMGDAGSMFLGLSLGVLLIQATSTATNALQPVTALWFVLLPMTDMFTIMYRRLKRGKSPMAPDRTHIHHILIRAGFNKHQTLHILVLTQTILVAIGVSMDLAGVAESISFLVAVLAVIAYQYLMKHAWRFVRWGRKQMATPH